MVKYQKKVCLPVLKKYYPEVFLEECKYIAKEKRYADLLLTTQKFLLMKKLQRKKILMRYHVAQAGKMIRTQKRGKGNKMSTQNFL